MQHESPYRPSAAEFPHDNPMLDRGALWIGSALCLIAGPRETQGVPPETEAIETTTATTTETATETTTETATETTTETPAIATASASATESAIDDPVATFVRAVTEVALAHGPAETASHIESLFQLGTLEAESLSPSAQAALLAGNIVETTDQGVRTTQSFASTRTAWEGVLRGESGDVSSCGESTLDAWTADVIARLIAHPDKAPTIRRDLRRRGIAAFGMLS